MDKDCLFATLGLGLQKLLLVKAFKCVTDSLHVKIIIPTRILAWHQFNTALDIFIKFHVKVELISGFRNPEEAKRNSDIVLKQSVSKTFPERYFDIQSYPCIC